MIKTLLLDEWRFLTFRSVSPAVQTNWSAFLALGLFFTWLAGIGRYWDNPRAQVVMTLSMLSILLAPLLAIAYIIYVFLAWRTARRRTA
jgi:phage shock protein PspC (stress-responsive transcriptional regulator)